MLIQYASDLHLEFPANQKFMQRQPLQAVGDVLILAGDILPFTLIEKHQDFFSFIADHFETTFWLPGNHEYYHFDIAQKSGKIHEAIRSNVFLVNNTSVMQAHVKLIFSTLWSRIRPNYQWQIENSLNDFHLIKHKGGRFSVEHYNQLHADCLTYIQQELASIATEKVAVFTHHCPTFLNYPEQYKGDALNDAFAVELFDSIEPSGIDCWGYGHHHTNTPEFNIGSTRLISNQLGYVQQNEHLMFQTDKVIKL